MPGIADLKRPGYQAGTSVAQIQPAQFIQDVGYDYAKQLAANGIIWETINVTLSDTVRTLYEESVEFSEQLESDFIFQHDVNLRFNDILILRTENYLILGNIEEAILSYGQIDFDQLGFEVNEECIQGVDASTLVECLCLVSHNGTCPFGD